MTTLSPKLGLGLPEATDLIDVDVHFGDNWQILDDLFGDVDRSVSSQQGIDYTPGWFATTTNPTIGNGILEGRSLQLGSLLIVQIDLRFGSTTTPGSGFWSFSLPAGFNEVSPNAMTGMGYAYDGSTQFMFMVSAREITSTSFRVTSNAGFVSPTAPFTWATDDELHGQVYVEVAP